MEFMPMVIGALMLLSFYIFDRKTIRVEWDKLASFIAFMTLVTFLRIAMYDLLMRIDPTMIPTMHRELLEIPKIFLTLVWWEDCFYVLPMFLGYKYLPKKYAHFLAILLSAHFGLGHLYQGIGGVLITSVYPYFISYKYGKKYGFGTVMCGHVLYDFITYYTVIVAPFLL